MQDEDQSHATPEVLQLGATQDKDGNIIPSRVKICNFYDLYWRVEFSDGDWNELTR